MRHVLLIGAAALLLPSLLLAQAQGRVKGIVHDSKGNPIADAKVIITCPEITNFRKELTTDKEGVFVTLIVDATQRYLFHVEAAGYQPVERVEKPLIGGQTLEIEFTLMTLKQAQEEAKQEMLEQPGYKELNEGRELLNDGKRAEAREKFAAAVAAKPDLQPAWQQLAFMDLQDGKSAEALKEAEKCLELAPNYAPCLAVAVNSAQATGNKELYEKYLAAYKLANPSDPAMMFNDVIPLLNQGDYAKAEPLLKDILNVDPDYPEALYQMGIIYVNKGDYPTAMKYLEHFVKVAPDDKDAGTAKGMIDWLKTQVK